MTNLKNGYGHGELCPAAQTTSSAPPITVCNWIANLARVWPLAKATTRKSCCVGRMMAATLGATNIGQAWAKLANITNGCFGGGWA